jgi:hypothetical protein
MTELRARLQPSGVAGSEYNLKSLRMGGRYGPELPSAHPWGISEQIAVTTFRGSAHLA